jgi:ABC-type oligopeptide transport system substrate-binding subunit
LEVIELGADRVQQDERRAGSGLHVSQARAVASVAYSISLTETKKFYSALRGEKELVWADGTPFDYYDSQAQIDNAVANVTRFFRTHLSEELAA